MRLPSFAKLIIFLHQVNGLAEVLRKVTIIFLTTLGYLNYKRIFRSRPYAKMKKMLSEATLHYMLCVFARKYIQHVVCVRKNDAEIKNGEGIVDYRKKYVTFYVTFSDFLSRYHF